MSPAPVRYFSEAIDDEFMGFSPAARTGKRINRSNAKEIFPYDWGEKDKLETALLRHYPKYYATFLKTLRPGM